jgi:hypothetical protein
VFADAGHEPDALEIYPSADLDGLESMLVASLGAHPAELEAATFGVVPVARRHAARG